MKRRNKPSIVLSVAMFSQCHFGHTHTGFGGEVSVGVELSEPQHLRRPFTRSESFLY